MSQARSKKKPSKAPSAKMVRELIRAVSDWDLYEGTEVWADASALREHGWDDADEAVAGVIKVLKRYGYKPDADPKVLAAFTKSEKNPRELGFDSDWGKCMRQKRTLRRLGL